MTKKIVSMIPAGTTYKNYCFLRTTPKKKAWLAQYVFPALMALLVTFITDGNLKAQNNTIQIDPANTKQIPAKASPEYNFIKTTVYREPLKTEPSGSSLHSEEIQYFDGLGRPIQVIQVGASPSGNDIIQPVLYDAFGREAIRTLPYVSESRSGAFVGNVTEVTVNNYYSSGKPEGVDPDNRAFALTVFDNSPLNRVVSQGGPGADWKSRPVSTNYLTNTVSVKGWKSSGDSFTLYDYAPKTLYVFETIDEDRNVTREYKDKLGQVVLKEAKLGDDWLRTYYIFDDFGLLRCVVPPAADSPADAGLCYYYRYDGRLRLTEKRIPGGGTITMVYDKRDRFRLSQNSLQAVANEWSFIKYDALNRPVVSGIIKNSSSGADALESAVNTNPLNESPDRNREYGYDNASYPTSGTEVQSVTWYDNYGFLEITSLNKERLDSLSYTKYEYGTFAIGAIVAGSDKGRVTGSMTRVLSAEADADAIHEKEIYSAVYYDKYGNVLRTLTENHLGGTDVVSNQYEDITYQLLRSRQDHYRGSDKLSLEKRFAYDNSGRLVSTRLKVNAQPEITLNAMKYNETGQLVAKYLHSGQTAGNGSFVQKTDFRYNIRGWLTKINDPVLDGSDDLFGMQLYYSRPADIYGPGSADSLFNGNIAALRWGIKNDTVRGFRFRYDDLNRLMEAEYAQGNDLKENPGYFSEIVTGYDKNGNIRGLTRKHNNLLVDDLAYQYYDSGKSNHLKKITDTGLEGSGIDDYPGTSMDYLYDASGNMRKDGSKNLHIGYHNTLNIPAELDFGNDNRIFYHYSAGGTKLVKHGVSANGNENYTHYIGNIVYEGGILSYILTEEGRLVSEGSGTDRRFRYEYNLKDHLGNNRVTFLVTETGGTAELVQSTDYYPFGLVMNQYNANTLEYKKNKYLYNGKELQDDVIEGSSLNWFDYGARFYDPQIGRWTTSDPKADKYYSFSPNNYVLNNPLKFIDPDGKEVVISQGTLTNAQFTQFKQQTLTAMQALTNDQLAWRGNTLIITKLGGANSGKNLTYGTNLIQEQNSKQVGHKTTTIESTAGGNSATGASTDVNKTASGANGPGDNATVEWNPNKTTGGTDINGSTNRPTEVGLGHELVHANHMNKGERDTGSSGKPDGDGTGVVLSNEEYKTRVDENKIRKEQGVTPRKL